MEGTAVKPEEVRDASARLPQRQREALELRDRARRSYEEIAASLEISPGAVAQLIAHARINLYDELRGTALASVAPSQDCERALPLIAMREDGQLKPASEDARWLDSHLAGCERCALAVEQMSEAEAAYRDWAPDVSTTSAPGVAPTPSPGVAAPLAGRRRAVLAAALTGLLILGGVVVLAGADRSTKPVESADTAAAQSIGGGKSAARPAGKSKKNGEVGRARRKRAEKRSNADGESAAGPADGLVTAPTTALATGPVESGGSGAGSDEPSSGASRPPGKAAVEPTRQTSTGKPAAKQKPAPAPASSPQSTAATAPTPEPAPAEEAPDGPGRSEEAPGKPANRPPH
jgi:Sigma-70, region 4